MKPVVCLSTVRRANYDLLVLWVFVTLNDLYILTLDFGWTNTYPGCIAVQILLNTCFVALIIAVTVKEAQYGGSIIYIYMSIMHTYGPAEVIVWIFIPLSGVCSLYLLFTNTWPIFVLRRRMPIRNLLKTNNKDAFTLIGTIDPLAMECALSISGRSRTMDTPISPLKVILDHHWSRIPEPARRPARLIKKTIFNMLFRRVKSVESRLYAFMRNGFAMCAIGALIFRAVTATSQAQSQFGTRVVSDDCSSPEDVFHFIHILVERDPSPQIDITIWKNYANIRANTSFPITTTAPCNLNVSQSLQERGSGITSTGATVKVLDLYICEIDNFYQYNVSLASLAVHVGYPSFQVEARRRDGLEFSTASVMPSIWLLNSASFYYHFGGAFYFVSDPEHSSSYFPLYPDPDLVHIHPARSYLPSWELRSGAHIEAEAKLITRRFITSSIMNDVIFNSKPTYSPLSLYPIYETSGGTFNYPNRSIATTRIQVSSKPGLMYFRRNTDLQNFNLNSTKICDFIDDYRTGTVFDVIGSVGGLFALLQTLHVFLFGRPLLWGLIGNKPITPFGWVGKWSSERLKHRLRQKYHQEAPEGSSDTFLITSFLRDFEIDFGPADPEPVHRQEAGTSGGN